MKRSLLLILILTVAVHTAHSQDDPGFLRSYFNGFFFDTANAAEPRFLIYPTVAYAPETSWEVGLSSLYIYYANRDTTNRLSEISGFSFYTFENQYGFWFDHALYSDKNKWFFLGRTRFQSFPLLYYGIGPQAPADYLARVDGKFLLIKERILREVARSVYLGVEIDYQNLFDVNFKLADPNEGIETPAGGRGSSNLGLGLGLVYDNRHNVLNVRDGLFSELAFLRYDKLWGSDFSFTTLISDNRIYRSVGRRNVFAAQLFGQFTLSGEAPFNQLALMGGESLMRGYYLGRFRDKNLVAGQVEFRALPFSFSKRLGAAAFIGAGQVFGDESSLRLANFLPAGGGGLRFLLFPSKDIWTRLDVAFTREGPGFYFFIGEAF